MTRPLPPGRYAPGGREYIFNQCPKCGEANKFYWSVEKSKGLCLRGTCGLKIGSYPSLKRWSSVELGVVFPDTLGPTRGGQVKVRTHVPIGDTTHGRAYMEQRGWDPEYCYRMGLRAGKDKEYIRVPMASTAPGMPSAAMERGAMGGGRWMYKSESPHKSSYFICSTSLYRTESPPSWGVIVEGAGDLLRHRILECRGVAVCGSRVGDMVARWISQRFSRVVVWSDSDEAGGSLYSHLAGKLPAMGCEVQRYLDTNYRDPGSTPEIFTPSTLLRQTKLTPTIV